MQTSLQRGSGIESLDRNHVWISSQSIGTARHRGSHALGADQQNAMGGLGNAAQAPQLWHMDGSLFDARLYIDDRLIVDKHGMLDRALLYHPEVLEVASQFGDPYKVLAPVSHEAHGSGTAW